MIVPTSAVPTPPPAPWTEGAPIPPGYHVEQQMRSGLLTAGILVTAIPYVVGLAVMVVWTRRANTPTTRVAVPVLLGGIAIPVAWSVDMHPP